jgi:hydroxypyruvate isomerase
MRFYFAAILAFALVLWLYDQRRQKRLDADPAQHHLASLLIGSVTGAPGASERLAAEHLDRIASGSADRRVRLNHAMMLVRRQASPELYSGALELARRI